MPNDYTPQVKQLLSLLTKLGVWRDGPMRSKWLTWTKQHLSHAKTWGEVTEDEAREALDYFYSLLDPKWQAFREALGLEVTSEPNE